MAEAVRKVEGSSGIRQGNPRPTHKIRPLKGYCLPGHLLDQNGSVGICVLV